jgi:hypothetical protein
MGQVCAAGEALDFWLQAKRGAVTAARVRVRVKWGMNNHRNVSVRIVEISEFRLCASVAGN